MYKIAESIQESPRAHLLMSNAALIDRAADVFTDVFKDLKAVCYILQPVLTNIRTEVVSHAGVVKKGSLEWSCSVSSAYYGKRMKIGFAMPVVEGTPLRPMYFYNSVNVHYALTESGIREAMNLPAGYRYRRRGTSVQRSYLEER